MAEQAIRVTLSTGKVVVIRLPKIKHQEQAMRAVGKKAQGNPELLQFLSGVELIKLLLVKVDKKDFSYKDWETKSLDDVFDLKEIKQITLAISQFTQDEEEGFLPKTEAVSIGE